MLLFKRHHHGVMYLQWELEHFPPRILQPSSTIRCNHSLYRFRAEQSQRLLIIMRRWWWWCDLVSMGNQIAPGLWL